MNHAVVAEGHPHYVFTPETLSRTYGADMIVIRHDNVLVIADRLTAEGEPEPDLADRLSLAR